MPLVGVSGWPNAGKGEVAKALRDIGWYEEAFADSLRDMLSVINPLIQDRMRWNDAMEFPGYRAAKDLYPEIRRLMHGLGTRVGREMIDPDLWVNQMEERLSTLFFQQMQSFTTFHGIVVPDVRFENEVSLIESFSGIVLRVERPGWPSPESEIEHHLDDHSFAHVIVNDGTVEDLKRKVYAVTDRL